MKKILVCKNISKTFKVRNSNFFNRARVRALSNVDIEIDKGEILGLVGESGCGKSTLGNIIAGIIKADEGKILFLDEDISNKEMRRKSQVKDKIQMIFQDSQGSLNPKKTMAWHLDETLRTIRGLRENKKDLVLNTLKNVGLKEDLLEKYPNQLSGGEAQRFNIALALLKEPILIIADEPVSSLDVSIQAQVLNLMNDLKEKYDLTYLFISHNLDVVKTMSDNMAVMYLGHIVEYGRAKDIYEKPLHPYSKVLIASIPRLEGEREKTNLIGEVPDPSNIPNGCPFNPRCIYAKEICKKMMPNKVKYKDRYVVCHLYNEDGFQGE